MHYPILEVSQVEETIRAQMAVPGTNPCHIPGWYASPSRCSPGFGIPACRNAEYPLQAGHLALSARLHPLQSRNIWVNASKSLLILNCSIKWPRERERRDLQSSVEKAEKE